MQQLIDALKEYTELGVHQQIDYDKFYLYSIITHSTAVEGSTVTEIENRLLFDEGISPAKPIKEQLMNLDLKKAYEMAQKMAESHEEYSVEQLCRLAAAVMKNTGTEYKTMAGDFSSANGDLRLLNVTAGRGGRSYMSHQKVPDKLKSFCAWLNRQREFIKFVDVEKVYELSFLAHYNLVTIHPWADGNGRMARLVMNMLQMEYGVVPSIVKKESREEYITTLARSQDAGNSAEFLAFMIRHHTENLRKAVVEFKESVEAENLNFESLAEKVE